MRSISYARFEAMVSYCRNPLARYLLRELAWFEVGDEQVLGMLAIDTDAEFSGTVFARDLRERFRWVRGTSFWPTAEQAIQDLSVEMNRALEDLESTREQGDEKLAPVDFFGPVVDQEKLGRGFTTVNSTPGYRPARAILAEMMRWHEDVDGNFVEQFQTSGFDTRVWELYLFAALVESGLSVARPSPAPDFLCSSPEHGEFAVEATSVNPSADRDGVPTEPPRPESDDELEDYARNFLPIKYAGPLTAKLKKEYWKMQAAKSIPLVFAIQDFHDTLSMSRTRVGLATYLYGLTQSSSGSIDQVVEHVWKGKRVPSNFFSQPGAQYVSAVIFNASGTLSKFNRMGVAAGFGTGDVVLIRRGLAYDPDPAASTPRPYEHIVCEGYEETWSEGMEVYHNPRAVHPLKPAFLPGAVHHYLMDDGQVSSHISGWAPFSSITSIIHTPRVGS